MRYFAFALIFSTAALAACSESRTPTGPGDVVPPAQEVCVYSISTTTFNMSGAGGQATFAVNTGAGCAWSVTNNSSSFVTVASGSSGTGTGSVTFTVPVNSGDARTGTLSVAGQNIVINQATNDPLFGDWSGTIVKGAGCPAQLLASVDWSGTFRRTSGATTELAISIAPVGVFNQVIPVTFNGNNLQLFVPIDTLYTFNATLASDRRSFTGTFSGGSCSGTWSGSRR